MTTTTNQLIPAAGEHAGRSPLHLSREEVQFFDDNGYLVLRGRITGDLLERLQQAGQHWIEQGMAARASVDWDPHVPAHADFRFVKRDDKEVMYRVDYLHNKGLDVSLELLGDPRILAIAESMCGSSFVPTYESMVFKQAGDAAEIPWHQDALHPHRNWRIFNLDLYLDAATTAEGALRVVPGSHRTPADICRIRELEGWDGPNVTTVEMQPGDVLLHDVMVVHGSPHVLGNHLRRTIYYEFRPAEEIAAEGPWDGDWITRRMKLLSLAHKKFACAYPDVTPFDWTPSSDFITSEQADGEVELRIAHSDHSPSAFCSAGDVPIT